ncbi:MAG: CDP-glucose 4,6-dehydratase [Hylemonella sp.]|nr:CDP-glucose 4,6-dehydratase [Hylemonella sp.]
MPGAAAMARPTPDFWRGKRVLLTGHTGFKGAWLAQWLQLLGAQVSGLALAPQTTPSLYEAAGVGALIDERLLDLRDGAGVAAQVQSLAPEIVLHLAAQALVREGYQAPAQTFATNVMGTVNLLDALRGCASVRTVLVVTTDKVYRNHAGVHPFREDDPLGGHDPYSASKAAAELVTSSYADSFLRAQGVAVATARAGNVIGGGDWAADRLLPDAVRAWQAGTALTIRRPQAVRPWQHVLEPLAGYLRLVEHLWEQPQDGGAFNFGPPTDQAAAVRSVVELARAAWGGGEVLWGDGAEGPHEAAWLALEPAKARALLGWRARWDLAQSVRRSLDWYRRYRDGGDARALCLSDIADFSAERAP